MTAPPERTMAEAAAAIDLSLCAKEPIHIPGAIQPHGGLLAARADGTVTHASANLLAILGKPAHSVLGRSLAEVVGKAAARALLAVNPGDAAAARKSYLLPGPNGRPLHLDAYRAGQRICVDIEPIPTQPWGPRQPVTMAEAILETFRQATTPGELCSLAVRGFRTITGYDRVIVYRFHPDGSGEVIAEECATGLDPYLGICYPASDIPPQARQQYLHQRVGMVADSSYQPVPVLSEPLVDDGSPLDLTHSTLRSVSPFHRQYMRNMKTVASMTIGLPSGPELWGMLVCHHGQAQVLGPDLRAVAGIVGQVMSLLLVSLTEADRFARQHERRVHLRGLVERFALGMPLADSLAGAERDLLRLVNATGALVSYAGTLRCLGRTPPAIAAERALATLQLASGRVQAIDDLGVSYPALGGCTSDGSGALLLPLTQGSSDAILWFRPEQSRTVSWGGNPAEHTTADPITGEPSPRTSFAIWKETVRGRSAPWEEIDLTLALELRTAIDLEVARRTRSELLSLRQVHIAADEPNQQRTLELEEFAYAASHDLKAPLRAIGHLAEWISEDLGPETPPETIENLKLLMGRVRRLQFLLGGLLTYSRVGRQTDAVLEDVNISALIEDIVTQLAPPKGFSIVWPKDLPVIRTYRVLLGVVLTNLIENAVKHHDRAAGRIEITMRKVGGLAEFRVGDDGPGIPPQFHDRVFLVFQTLVSRDDMEASGIGLAIVKKMVLSNGGRIWIESDPAARGSSFVFTWKNAAS